MKNAYIGSAVERREDWRFLRGRGQYVDDLRPEGLLYAVILRSSVAHGRIVSIDASAALRIAGLHAVIGLFAALEQRRRTGRGQLVEVPLVEPGLNFAAEQVIEYSAYGVLLGSEGNRGPDAAAPCVA